MEPKTNKTYRPFKDDNELINMWDAKLGAFKSDIFLPIIWIKSKATGAKCLVGVFQENGIYTANDMFFDWEKLLELFTFLDGTPCGVEE